MQMATSIETETGEMLVKRVSVPIGLEEVMEDLTREVMLKKPKDIYVFASEFFAHLLALRDKGSIRGLEAKKLQSLTKPMHTKVLNRTTKSKSFDSTTQTQINNRNERTKIILEKHRARKGASENLKNHADLSEKKHQTTDKEKSRTLNNRTKSYERQNSTQSTPRQKIGPIRAKSENVEGRTMLRTKSKGNNHRSVHTAPQQINEKIQQDDSSQENRNNADKGKGKSPQITQEKSANADLKIENDNRESGKSSEIDLVIKSTAEGNQGWVEKLITNNDKQIDLAEPSIDPLENHVNNKDKITNNEAGEQTTPIVEEEHDSNSELTEKNANNDENKLETIHAGVENAISETEDRNQAVAESDRQEEIHTNITDEPNKASINGNLVEIEDVTSKTHIDLNSIKEVHENIAENKDNVQDDNKEVQSNVIHETNDAQSKKDESKTAVSEEEAVNATKTKGIDGNMIENARLLHERDEKEKQTLNVDEVADKTAENVEVVEDRFTLHEGHEKEDKTLSKIESSIIENEKRGKKDSVEIDLNATQSHNAIQKIKRQNSFDSDKMNENTTEKYSNNPEETSDNIDIAIQNNDKEETTESEDSFNRNLSSKGENDKNEFEIKKDDQIKSIENCEGVDEPEQNDSKSDNINKIFIPSEVEKKNEHLKSDETIMTNKNITEDTNQIKSENNINNITIKNKEETLEHGVDKNKRGSVENKQSKFETNSSENKLLDSDSTANNNSQNDTVIVENKAINNLGHLNKIHQDVNYYSNNKNSQLNGNVHLKTANNKSIKTESRKIDNDNKSKSKETITLRNSRAKSLTRDNLDVKKYNSADNRKTMSRTKSVDLSKNKEKISKGGNLNMTKRNAKNFEKIKSDCNDFINQEKHQSDKISSGIKIPTNSIAEKLNSNETADKANIRKKRSFDMDDKSKFDDLKSSSFDVEKLHKEIEEAGKLKTNPIKTSFDPLLLKQEIKMASRHQDHVGLDKFTSEVAAALKIQSLWRGFSVRNRKLTAGNRKLVIAIEDDKNQKGESKQSPLERAVVKIQALWRGFNVRKHIKQGELFGKMVVGNKTNQISEELKDNNCGNSNKKAATKIQAAWRGYQVRKSINEVDKKFSELEGPSRSEELLIPPSSHGHEKLIDEDILNAATKIQARFRGFSVRKQYKKHSMQKHSLKSITEESTKSAENQQLSENKENEVKDETTDPQKNTKESENNELTKSENGTVHQRKFDMEKLHEELNKSFSNNSQNKNDENVPEKDIQIQQDDLKQNVIETRSENVIKDENNILQQQNDSNDNLKNASKEEVGKQRTTENLKMEIVPTIADDTNHDKIKPETLNLEGKNKTLSEMKEDTDEKRGSTSIDQKFDISKLRDEINNFNTLKTGNGRDKTILKETMDKDEVKNLKELNCKNHTKQQGEETKLKGLQIKGDAPKSDELKNKKEEPIKQTDKVVLPELNVIEETNDNIPGRLDKTEKSNDAINTKEKSETNSDNKQLSTPQLSKELGTTEEANKQKIEKNISGDIKNKINKNQIEIENNNNLNRELKNEKYLKNVEDMKAIVSPEGGNESKIDDERNIKKDEVNVQETDQPKGASELVEESNINRHQVLVSSNDPDKSGTEDDLLKEELAAQKIQSNFRGYRVRRDLTNIETDTGNYENSERELFKINEEGEEKDNKLEHYVENPESVRNEEKHEKTTKDIGSEEENIKINVPLHELDQLAGIDIKEEGRHKDKSKNNVEIPESVRNEEKQKATNGISLKEENIKINLGTQEKEIAENAQLVGIDIKQDDKDKDKLKNYVKIPESVRNVEKEKSVNGIESEEGKIKINLPLHEGEIAENPQLAGIDIKEQGEDEDKLKNYAEILKSGPNEEKQKTTNGIVSKEENTKVNVITKEKEIAENAHLAKIDIKEKDKDKDKLKTNAEIPESIRNEEKQQTIREIGPNEENTKIKLITKGKETAENAKLARIDLQEEDKHRDKLKIYAEIPESVRNKETQQSTKEIGSEEEKIKINLPLHEGEMAKKSRLTGNDIKEKGKGKKSLENYAEIPKSARNEEEQKTTNGIGSKEDNIKINLPSQENEVSKNAQLAEIDIKKEDEGKKSLKNCPEPPNSARKDESQKTTNRIGSKEIKINLPQEQKVTESAQLAEINIEEGGKDKDKLKNYAENHELVQTEKAQKITKQIDSEEGKVTINVPSHEQEMSAGNIQLVGIKTGSKPETNPVIEGTNSEPVTNQKQSLSRNLENGEIEYVPNDKSGKGGAAGKAEIEDKTAPMTTSENSNEKPQSNHQNLLHTGEMHDALVIPIPIRKEEATQAALDPVNTMEAQDGHLLSIQLSQAPPAGAEVLTSPPPPSCRGAQASVKDASTCAAEPCTPSSPVSMDVEKRNNAVVRNMEVEAATKIQAGFRGYQVRKQLKNKNGATANEISSQRRRSLRRKNSGRSIETRSSAQGVQGKTKPKDTSDDLEEKSAVKIQAGIRGFLVRRRQENQKQTKGKNTSLD